MPLLDHFRKPLESRAPWCSIGNMWVSKLVQLLNKQLPKRQYLALGTVHLGSQSEADIAEYQLKGDSPPTTWNDSTQRLVPEAIATVEAKFPEPDEYAVRVHDERDGMKLVGAIEFVSPSNKDREEARIQLVQKCMSYLKLGIGMVLVDIVTTRGANLHNDLMHELRAAENAFLPEANIYVAGYQPWVAGESCQLKLWPYALELGKPIPAVPLALKGGPVLMIDLEETYLDTLTGHNVDLPEGA